MDKQLLNDVIEWDVVNWGRALAYWQDAGIDFKGCKVLDIGSRNGGLSLWFALQGAEVVCSDLDGPTEQAIALHKKYGVADKIRYEEIDATNIPYTNYFDVVVFKSVLGGIGADENVEKQKKAISEMQKAIDFENGKGYLLFAENMVATQIHTYFRRKYIPWGTHWRYAELNDLLGMLDAFEKVDYRTTGFLGAFGRNNAQRSFLGRIDGVLDRVIPEYRKYICIGIASGIKKQEDAV